MTEPSAILSTTVLEPSPFSQNCKSSPIGFSISFRYEQGATCCETNKTELSDDSDEWGCGGDFGGGLKDKCHFNGDAVKFGGGGGGDGGEFCVSGRHKSIDCRGSEGGESTFAGDFFTGTGFELSTGRFPPDDFEASLDFDFNGCDFTIL